MTHGARLLAVAVDAGGARALLPVAERLRRRGAGVSLCAAGPALRIWREEWSGVGLLEGSDDLSLKDAARVLERRGIDRLVSAAGLYNGMEHTFRRAARMRGIRTVAIMDSWLNYGERFERIMDGVVELSRPDLVCAIDDRSRGGLLAAGFSPEQVVVTGPPNLEAAMAAHRAITPVQREAWRRELGVGPTDRLMTFFSEPFITGPHGQCIQGPGALIGTDGRSLFGYTALEILEAVLDELDAAAAAVRQAWTVVVKPHPLEYDEPLRAFLARRGNRWVKTVLRREGSAARWIAIADVVIGMMTIALLEASLAGKPSLSVELGLLESGAEDPCIANLLGYTQSITTWALLRDAMQRIVTGDWDSLRGIPASPLPIDGAVERVAAEVLGARRLEATMA